MGQANETLVEWKGISFSPPPTQLPFRYHICLPVPMPGIRTSISGRPPTRGRRRAFQMFLCTPLFKVDERDDVTSWGCCCRRDPHVERTIMRGPFSGGLMGRPLPLFTAAWGMATVEAPFGLCQAYPSHNTSYLANIDLSYSKLVPNPFGVLGYPV